MKILLAEDTADLNKVICAVLNHEGYDVDPAFDGEEAMERINTEGYDCLILDIIMPKKDGIEVLREVREKNILTPVIMLTAKDDEFDKVLGLELGADDYVTKPYSSRELLARIKAVLRRRGQDSADAEEDTTLTAGSIMMDVERHVVEVHGQEVALPLKEFELLEMLLRNVDRVLTRGQLIDRVWGANYVGDTKTLDVHVKRLRAKIEDDPKNPVHLVTVRGLGYKFESSAH